MSPRFFLLTSDTPFRQADNESSIDEQMVSITAGLIVRYILENVQICWGMLRLVYRLVF